MVFYVLICLCMALAGVAGLQCMYLFYLDRIDLERKKHLRELETECKSLRFELEQAYERIAGQDEYIDSLKEQLDEPEEAWADVIDER